MLNEINSELNNNICYLCVITISSAELRE
jgi:hypothetical protein